jgi:hypothetical protein
MQCLHFILCISIIFCNDSRCSMRTYVSRGLYFTDAKQNVDHNTKSMSSCCRETTPWSRILLGGLLDAHLLMKFSAFRVTRKLIILCTRSFHWPLNYYMQFSSLPCALYALIFPPSYSVKCKHCEALHYAVQPANG